MIDLMEFDRCNDVRSVLEYYLTTLEEDQKPPPSFIDQAIENWKNQRIEIYAKLNQEGQILGIAVLGLVSNSISIICLAEAAHSLDKFEVEVIVKELFEAGYNRFKTSGEWITASGELEGDLQGHAIALGFRGFERASMVIGREILESIADPFLSPDYSFLPFDESMKEALGNLIFKGHVESVDVNVFPMFFSTRELALRLVENTIENRFGEFRSPKDSRILMKGDVLAGVCLITIRGNYAYIPDICIDPDLRRKGLGRALLVHTLKRLMTNHSDLDGVSLDVTLDNPAKHLYDSLGFKEQRRYKVLNWLRRWHN